MDAIQSRPLRWSVSVGTASGGLRTCLFKYYVAVVGGFWRTHSSIASKPGIWSSDVLFDQLANALGSLLVEGVEVVALEMYGINEV